MSLNEDTIRELQDVLGDGFSELVAAYLVDADNHLMALEQLLATEDFMAMERPAHALKGASGNIGAVDLYNAAADLVAQCRAGAVPDPRASVTRIRSCFEQAKPKLQKLMSK